MPIDKRSCYAQAKELLSAPGTNHLRYAALELRLCMELLTYEKLRSFSEVVPESVLNTWQPPQAVKALLEFEPNADKSFTLFAGIESEYGVPSKDMKYVGQHNSLSLKWLKKHYNKIGNLLHASNSGGDIDESKARSYLAEVIIDLEQPLQGNITGGSFKEVYSFRCGWCQQLVVCNVQAVSKSNKATCLNPQCCGEYHTKILPTGEAQFEPMVTKFDCIKCQAEIPIENRKLNVGIVFACPTCKTKHKIEDRQWGYAEV